MWICKHNLIYAPFAEYVCQQNMDQVCVIQSYPLITFIKSAFLYVQ